MSKPRLLFLVQLPPPVHGAAVDNRRVVNSEALQKVFETRTVEIPSARGQEDVGRWSPVKIVRSLTTLIRLSVELIRFQPHLVYFTPSPMGPAFYRDVLFSLVLHGSKAQEVNRLHGRGFRRGGTPRHFLARVLFRGSHVFLLSPLLQDDVENLVGENKLHFLPNGLPETVNNKKLSAIGAQQTKSESVRLLFVSNLHSSKGIDDLLDATSILVEKKTEFHLDVVGAGTKEIPVAQMRNEIHRRNLSQRVKIHGPKYDDEKKKIFLRTDIFCFPTYYPLECFPLVILEAMHYGLPVVATRVAAIPEMVDDGQTGFLVPPRAPKTLADTLNRLIKNQALRHEMGRQARAQFEEQYRFSSIERKLIAKLKEIVQKSE